MDIFERLKELFDIDSEKDPFLKLLKKYGSSKQKKEKQEIGKTIIMSKQIKLLERCTMRHPSESAINLMCELHTAIKNAFISLPDKGLSWLLGGSERLARGGFTGVAGLKNFLNSSPKKMNSSRLATGLETLLTAIAYRGIGAAWTTPPTTPITTEQAEVYEIVSNILKGNLVNSIGSKDALSTRGIEDLEKLNDEAFNELAMANKAVKVNARIVSNATIIDNKFDRETPKVKTSERKFKAEYLDGTLSWVGIALKNGIEIRNHVSGTAPICLAAMRGLLQSNPSKTISDEDIKKLCGVVILPTFDRGDYHTLSETYIGIDFYLNSIKGKKWEVLNPKDALLGAIDCMNSALTNKPIENKEQSLYQAGTSLRNELSKKIPDFTTNMHKGSATIDDTEWQIAKNHIEQLRKKGVIQDGYKIRRKTFGLNHSFIYVNNELYRMERTSEGKLGEGGFGLTKRIKNIKGEIKVVKIENSTIDNFKDDEENIRGLLGKNLGAFKRKSSTYKPTSRNQQKTYKKYSVMPLAKGTSLANFLNSKKGSLTQAEQITIAKNFINELKKLHSKKIIHNDVHTGNIIINPESYAVEIIDFGLSMVLDKNEKSKPHKDWDRNLFAKWKNWLPPEVVNNGYISEKSDIWMAGNVLKELGMPHLAEGMQNTNPEKRSSIWQILKNLQDRTAIGFINSGNYTEYAQWLFKLIESKKFDALKIAMEGKASNGSAAITWLADKNLAEYTKLLFTLIENKNFDALKIAMEGKASNGSAAIIWLADRNLAEYTKLLFTLIENKNFDALKVAMEAKNSYGQITISYLANSTNPVDRQNYSKIMNAADKKQTTNILTAAQKVVGQYTHENAKKPIPKTMLRFNKIPNKKTNNQSGLSKGIDMKAKNKPGGELIGGLNIKYLAEAEYTKLLFTLIENKNFNALKDAIEAKTEFGDAAIISIASTTKYTAEYINLLFELIKSNDFETLKVAMEAKSNSGDAAIIRLAGNDPVKYTSLLFKLVENNKFNALKIAMETKNHQNYPVIFILAAVHPANYAELLLNFIESKNFTALKIAIDAKDGNGKTAISYLANSTIPAIQRDYKKIMSAISKENETKIPIPAQEVAKKYTPKNKRD